MTEPKLDELPLSCKKIFSFLLAFVWLGTIDLYRLQIEDRE